MGHMIWSTMGYDPYNCYGLKWLHLKSQLIHFLSTTARRMKHETFLKPKLVSVEDLPRLVFICGNIEIVVTLVPWLLMVERSNENHGKSFSRKWHADCGILMFHQILIKLPTAQTKKLKEKLKLENFNLASDFMQICWTDYGFS